MQEDDAGLVREAQEGSLGAFSRLYERYFDRVYRYMMARVGDPAEAEDLTQELFLRVMGSLKSFRFRGPPFSAWLFRIARNLAVDRARRRKTAGGSVPLEEIVEVAGGENVEREALRALDRQEVARAIERLTQLQREVVLLRFMGGFSLAETATAMKRNENAIKALQHSALQALRRVLGDRLDYGAAGE